MKPDDPSVGDEDFKRSAHARLASLGRLVAAFDNEPGHVNDFRQTFPEAEVVLVGDRALRTGSRSLPGQRGAQPGARAEP
jgi:hypothetical protein